LPYITVSTADGRTFRRVLDKEILTIGRSSKNDINLTIDGSLSRMHAEIIKESEQYKLRDVGSRNGTSVNGVPVVQPVNLKPGDRITLGETTIIFGEGPATEVVIDDTPVGNETSTYTMSVDEIITHSNVFTSSGERPPVEVRNLTAALPAEASPENRTLTILSRAGMELINNRPQEEILNLIMDLVFEAISAERGFLMLLEGKSGDMTHKAVRDLTKTSGGAISLSRSIADMVIQNRQSVLTRDAQADERFKMRQSVVMQGIRSAMCVPLWNNTEVIGLIYVDSVSTTGSFTQEDLRLLTLLANIAAVKIENARLLEETIEMEKLEKELEQAADIQKRLLPEEMPQLENFEISGRADACRAVGGDYYDFVRRGDVKIGLAIGDVSGKGMAAALLMASVQAVFRTLSDVEKTPAGLVGSLNRHLIRSANPNKFVSFFFGELNPGTGDLQYVNAGHNPPILLRASGEVEILPASGVVLGVFAEAGFEERSVVLGPGDLLTLFSDGVTEWQNEEDAMYGEEGLMEALRKHGSKSAEEIVEAVLEEVLAFAGGAPQYDDATLLLLKRRP
jgi:serine phosphatase RsbU (regulator of sigma subunit)/pSer/pThr/pTyr-binding forkhead associated (FHA) protein